MLTSQRRALILDRLRRNGQVIAKEIAGEFSLSEDTIRRDLRDMAAEGLLQRVHGGAMPVSPVLPDLTARRSVAQSDKQRLGAAAARMIQPGQMVFLDGGTTTAEIVRHLPRDLSCTVVTHSPTIAGELEPFERIEIVLIGGRLYRHSMVATGAAAYAAIADLRPDLFFLGATAVHPAHGATTGDVEEAAIKRHIASVSTQTYLPLTAPKLDAVSPCRILPLSALSGIIVPEGLDEDVVTPYRATGVTVIEA